METVAMDTDHLHVIYIVGQGRSGSTLIDRVLGEFEGVESLCEIRHLWRQGFLENHHCSCGHSFEECGYWRSVAANIPLTRTDIQKCADLLPELTRTGRIPGDLAHVKSRRRVKEESHVQDCLQALYRTLAEITGSSVFVDSSKSPAGALLLSRIDKLTVHLLHIVRDIRGVVYSMQKGNISPQFAGPMNTMRPLRTVVSWIGRNAACEMLRSRLPYYRMRYEDFVRAPEEAIAKLGARIPPLQGRNPPNIRKGTLDLQEIHTIAGNPSRFASGTTTIREDLEWADRLSRRTRLAVTMTALPMILRYGYSLRNRG